MEGTRVRRGGWLRCGALVVVGCLAVAACGSSSDSGSPGKSENPAASSDFGTLHNVCHEADGTNEPGKHGVTADSVRVTTISDAGSDLQKGLNQELWDTATVFTRWCNDHGGINGRKIKLIKGDAQVTRYEQVIQQACKSSFALVGGGGALDNTGQATRVGCKLPAMPGFVASADARAAPLSFPAVTTAIAQVTSGGLAYLKKKYGGDQLSAIVYGNFPTTEFTMNQRLTVARDLGVASPSSPVVADPDKTGDTNQTYPATGLDDWRPVAQAIAAGGAEGLLFSGQPPDLGSLLTALVGEGDSKLQWVSSDPNMYDQIVVQTGRAGLAKIPVYVEIFTYPFEDAGKGKMSAAMDDFLGLFDHYLPNGKSHAMFAVSGFASWLLFAKAATACGAHLDRKCLIEQLHGIHSFDAGGLIAPRDPSKPQQASKCFALMKATPKGFVRVDDKYLKPNHGPFTCGAQYVHTFSMGTPPMNQYLGQLSKYDAAKTKKLEDSLD